MLQEIVFSLTLIILFQFFICGASKVATGTKETLVAMIQDVHRCDAEKARALFDEITTGRIASDIFD